MEDSNFTTGLVQQKIAEVNSKRKMVRLEHVLEKRKCHWDQCYWPMTQMERWSEWKSKRSKRQNYSVYHFELTSHKKDVVIIGFTHRVGCNTSVSAVVGLVQVLDEEIWAGDNRVRWHVVLHPHPIHLLRSGWRDRAEMTLAQCCVARPTNLVHIVAFSGQGTCHLGKEVVWPTCNVLWDIVH